MENLINTSYILWKTTTLGTCIFIDVLTIIENATHHIGERFYQN